MALYNLARVRSTTVGTGTIALGPAVPSFLDFAQAGAQSGQTVTYAIDDGINREIGRGVYTNGLTPELTRQVLRSTNGNNPIALSGNAQVGITAAAEDFELIIGSATAPANPPSNQLWYDTTIPQLKIWNGSNWVAASGFSDPTGAGAFGRTSTGTWQDVLPLAGGTLTAVTGVAGSGLGLRINADNDWTSPSPFQIYADDSNAGMYLELTNWTTNGIHIMNRSSSGSGIFVEHRTSSATGGGEGILASNFNTSTGSSAAQFQAQVTNSRALLLSSGGTATNALLLDIHNVVGVTGNTMVVRQGAGAGSQHFAIAATGVVSVGTPTGTAITGAGNINIAGAYHVNGVSIGTGPFLPLTGGVLNTVTDTAGGIVIDVNDNGWPPRCAIRSTLSAGIFEWVEATGPYTQITQYELSGANSVGLGIGLLSAGNRGISLSLQASGVRGIEISNFGAFTGTTAIESLFGNSGGNTGIVLSQAHAVTAPSNPSTWIRLQRHSHSAGTTPQNIILGNIEFAGKADTATTGTTPYSGAEIVATTTQAWAAAAAGTQLTFRTTPNGTRTMQDALTIDNSGTLRVGTPTGPAVTSVGAINVADGYYVNGVDIGANAPFLPLAGTTITTATDVIPTLTNASNWAAPAALRVVNADSDAGLHVDSSGAWGAGIYINNTGDTAYGISIRNAGTGGANGIYVNNVAAGDGITVGANLNNVACCALYAAAWAANTRAIRIINNAANTTAIHIRANAAALSSTLLDVGGAGGSVPPDILHLPATGTLTLGGPTGTAITGAGNINVSGGYYINGQPLEADFPGIADAPFLPLAGTTITNATDVIPTLTNASNWAAPAALRIVNADSDNGLLLNNQSDYGNGIRIDMSGTAAQGIQIEGTANSGSGIYATNRSAGVYAVQGINSIAGTAAAVAAFAWVANSNALFVRHNQNGATGLDISGLHATAGYSIRVTRQTIGESFRVDGSGLWLWDGTAIAPIGIGTVNPTATYKFLQEPTGTGTFGRTNAGAWQDVLALAGGGNLALSGTETIDVNNTGTGNSLRIRNGAANHFTIDADGNINAGTMTSNVSRLSITNATTATNSVAGIFINNSGTAGNGFGLRIATSNGGGNSTAIRIDASAGMGMQIIHTGVNGDCIRVNPAAAGSTGLMPDIRNAAAVTGILIPTSAISAANIGVRGRFFGATTQECLHIFPQGRIWLSTSDEAGGQVASALEIAPRGGTNTICIDVNNPDNTASLRIRRGATHHFVINGDGSVAMSPAFKAAMQAALA